MLRASTVVAGLILTLTIVLGESQCQSRELGPTPNILRIVTRDMGDSDPGDFGSEIGPLTRNGLAARERPLTSFYVA